MKLKKISAACALAFAGISGQALALSAFDTPDLKIYMSGATAPDSFIASIAAGMFDVGQGIFQYKDDNSTTTDLADDGKGWNAYFGVMKSTTDIPAALQGKSVMFVKRSRGGSVWGVDPMGRASRVATIKIGATDCVTSGATTYACPIIGVDPGIAGYTNAGNAGEVPDFGVSDVEPALFKAPYNVEFGQTALNATEVSRITVFPTNVLAMGIVATNAVPDTTYISRQDYGSMLMGAVSDWSKVDPTITTDKAVVICRRVQGSGTQASYNWFFDNFPCQSSFNGAVAPKRMPQSSGTGNGNQATPFELTIPASGLVIENPGSGDVRACLNAAQSHTDYNFKGDNGKWYRIKFSASANPWRAIGVLSTDSHASAFPTSAGAGFSFRYLDGAGVYNVNASTHVSGPGTGIAPSKANLMTGKYDFAVEPTMQYRNVAVTNIHGDVVPALTGDKQTFVDLFILRSGDPAFNTAPQTAAIPPNYAPTLDAAGVPTNNVARGARGGNTCKPWRKLL